MYVRGGIGGVDVGVRGWRELITFPNNPSDQRTLLHFPAAP